MTGKNRGFTEYQQTLFNKYEVDESYLQTRKQRRACLDLLEKVDKNQVVDEKKLISRIATAFEGTRLYQRVASCVTIAALLVTLQGTPAMANAEAVYRDVAVTAEWVTRQTENRVVTDDDSFLTAGTQKLQKARPGTLQHANIGNHLQPNQILLDDDSDVFKSYRLASADEPNGDDSVTITFEDPDKTENVYEYSYAPFVTYDLGDYKLLVGGTYYGTQWVSTAGETPDMVVQTVYDNYIHFIGLIGNTVFDIDSISITNNMYDSLTITFTGNDLGFSGYTHLCDVEIEAGKEKIIDFSGISGADRIGWLNIYSADSYGNASSNISIDDIKISNISSATPVITDNTKYGTEGTVMNFTVSDFVYRDATGDPLGGILIVLPPDPAHGVLKMGDDLLEIDDEVTAANLDKITFTPASGFTGTTSFTYKGYDGTGYSKNPGTMTLVITPLNTPPVAMDNNTWSTDQNRPILNGDLTGDVIDVDTGGTFTFERVTNAAHGDVTVNPDGSFTYNPHTDFYGTDSFTWRVSDGTAWSNTATVTITVRQMVMVLV